MKAEQKELKKKKHRRVMQSIKFRINALIILVVLVAFVFMFVAVANVLETTLLDDKITAYQTELGHVAIDVSKPLAAQDTQKVYDIITGYALDLNARIMLFNDEYVVIADSASLYNGYYLPYRTVREITEYNAPASSSFHDLASRNGEGSEFTMYCARPVMRNGSKIATAFISVSVQAVSQRIISADGKTVSCMVVSLIFIIILTYATLGTYIDPILELTEKITQRTAAKKPVPEKVGIHAKGEIAELVDAYDTMNSSLCQYDAIRDTFIANASHELRTPLTSMKALSEAMTETDPDNIPKEMMLEFFRDVTGEVDRMDNLIRTLLDVVREGADGNVVDESVAASQVIAGVIRMMRPIAEKKKLRLIINIQDSIMIKMNQVRLERIVTNLISNAVRYTESGAITVTAILDDDSLQISVKDTGIGIPEESLPHLFERFYRVDKARSRASGGVGLGLSMVSDIVSKYGGRIDVESRQGRGSKFTITLPNAWREK